MIAAVILFSLSEIVFNDQQTPGLRILEVNPLNGKATLNAIQGDISGDGKTDLVFEDMILLQRDGRFESLPTPEHFVNSKPSMCDIFAGSLYLRFADGLIAYRWNGQRWVTILDQRIMWPRETRPGGEPEPNALRFERFLHDINDDRVPEIVVPSAKGLHLYSLSRGSYSETTLLDIFPEPRHLTSASMVIWPPEKRRLRFPTLRTRFRTYIDGVNVCVVVEDHVADDTVQFNWTHYRIDPKTGFILDPYGTRRFQSQPMAAYLRPCNLNNDGILDFAGGKLTRSQASSLPAPVFETSVIINNKTSTRTIRSRSFSPLSSYIDINGDSNLDLIVETTELFDGDIRDVLTRSLNDRSVYHRVSAFFQHRDGTFSQDSDVSTRHRINFKQPPLREDNMFKRYKEGNLVNVTGDFNEDGLKDLVVQDAPTRLSIYINRNNKFQIRPDHRLPIREDWYFGVADLDSDGRSDVIVFPSDSEISRAQGSTWFAREHLN